MQRDEIIFEPMPRIGKHHVHPYSNAVLFQKAVTASRNLLINKYRVFQSYLATEILVSRFVAKPWPAFRAWWRECGIETFSAAWNLRIAGAINLISLAASRERVGVPMGAVRWFDTRGLRPPALAMPTTWIIAPSVITPRSANQLRQAKQLSGTATASNNSRFMAKGLCLWLRRPT
jgi:hypothetical protein